MSYAKEENFSELSIHFSFCNYLQTAFSRVSISFLYLGMPRDKRLDQWIDELTKEENRKAYEASREVDVMQPQIKEILKIKCSPIKKKELRAPLEEALHSR